MQRAGWSFCAGRGVALVIAVGLSGGLPLVGSLAGDHEHRCACRHAVGEACGCTGCRRAAARARRERVAEAPSRCHSGAAGCPGAAGREAAPAEAPPLPARVAVLLGCCGPQDREATALQIADPFVPPRAEALVLAADPESPLAIEGSGPRDVARVPPTPPPRAA